MKDKWTERILLAVADPENLPGDGCVGWCAYCDGGSQALDDKGKYIHKKDCIVLLARAITKEKQ